MVALNPTHILYPSLYIIQEVLSPWSNPNWYSLLGFPASQQPHSPRFLHVYVCTTYNLVNTSRGKSAWTVMITFLLFPFLWDLCESFIGCFGSYELHFFFSLSASGDCQNILQTPLTLRSHFYTSVYLTHVSIHASYESANSLKGIQGKMLRLCRINFFLFSWFLIPQFYLL